MDEVAEEVGEVSLPGEAAEVEAEGDSHPEVAAGEDLEEEAVVAVAEAAAGVVVEAGEAEPRWSSSRTDTRASSSPAARRTPWSPRTWLSVRACTARKGSLSRTRLERSSTEFGIHSDQSWQPPYLVVSTKFTCRPAAR